MYYVKQVVFSSDSGSLSCQTLSLAISCDPVFFMISKILKINYQYVLCFCQGKLNSLSIQQNEMFTFFFCKLLYCGKKKLVKALEDFWLGGLPEQWLLLCFFYEKEDQFIVMYSTFNIQIQITFIIFMCRFLFMVGIYNENDIIALSSM